MKDLHFVFVILFLAACGGSSTQANPNPPNPNTPGNGNTGYTGTLIAEGTSYGLTLDLNALDPTKRDQWVKRDSVSVYEAAAVALSSNELLIASDTFGSLMTVEVKDLNTFGLKESFEWSNDESVGRVNGLGVSQDGKYVAALVEGLGSPYLEVLDRVGRRVVYSGLDIVADDTLTWTANNELVLALNLSSEGDPERWGAIGVIPLERGGNTPNGHAASSNPRGIGRV